MNENYIKIVLYIVIYSILISITLDFLADYWFKNIFYCSILYFDNESKLKDIMNSI